jgi:hypothetical protein
MLRPSRSPDHRGRDPLTPRPGPPLRSKLRHLFLYDVRLLARNTLLILASMSTSGASSCTPDSQFLEQRSLGLQGGIRRPRHSCDAAAPPEHLHRSRCAGTAQAWATDDERRWQRKTHRRLKLFLDRQPPVSRRPLGRTQCAGGVQGDTRLRRRRTHGRRFRLRADDVLPLHLELRTALELRADHLRPPVWPAPIKGIGELAQRADPRRGLPQLDCATCMHACRLACYTPSYTYAQE